MDCPNTNSDLMTMGPTETRAAELLLLAHAAYLEGREDDAFALARRADERLTGTGLGLDRRHTADAPRYEDWSLAKYKRKWDRGSRGRTRRLEHRACRNIGGECG